MKRRDFLKLLSLYPLAMQVPFALAGNSLRGMNRTLILIELKGGNDGLNTVIPFADPAYYQLRRNIAIPRDQVMQLNESVALHPSLRSLLPLWKNKQMAIVQGVGYDKPNLSHFRSIDIWNSGSGSEVFSTEGWLSKIFKGVERPSDLVADGISIGRDYGPMTGAGFNAVTLLNVKQFIRQAKSVHTLQQAGNNPALQHLRQVQQKIKSSASRLEAGLVDDAALQNFPKTAIGRQLKLVSQILMSNIYVPVIRVTLGSFDTHTNQPVRHARLLKEFADAIAIFSSLMQEKDQWQRLMMLSYSEFGRRVAENGSRGTDHGTASSQFIMGGNIPPGLFGKQPSLTDLDNGNLKYVLDYRGLYNTAANWMGLYENPFSTYKLVMPVA